MQIMRPPGSLWKQYTPKFLAIYSPLLDESRPKHPPEPKAG